MAPQTQSLAARTGAGPGPTPLVRYYLVSRPRAGITITLITHMRKPRRGAEGTFLSCPGPGLPDFCSHGGAQQVRHTGSAPVLAGRSRGNRRLAPRLSFPIGEMGMPRSGRPGERAVAARIGRHHPSVCGPGRRPGLHPHTPQPKPEPSHLPVFSSKKCGSPISPASFPRFPGDTTVTQAADRKRQRPQGEKGPAPLNRRGKRLVPVAADPRDRPLSGTSFPQTCTSRVGCGCCGRPWGSGDREEVGSHLLTS